MAILCSPDRQFGRTGRNQECDNTCPSWEDCVKELGLKENFKPARFVRRKPTKRQIEKGNYLTLRNKTGEDYKYVWKKSETLKENIFKR